ncbi:hypothetical protein [Acinetobacter pittii]|uniref:hypothetical protein n=1 Tax=Acinetobacter pittii TaxID=48296 RepID=UPI0039F4E6A7
MKVAFIVEGGTEKILIESEQFKKWIQTFGLELIVPVVDASGGGNLLPHRIGDMLGTLANKNPDHIFILTDLEREPNIATVKSAIEHPDVKDSFITILATESWFLACTDALRSWLPSKDTYVEDPESFTGDKPFDRIKVLKLKASEGKRGVSNKKILARQMLLHGFTFEKVLEHPNCSSMKYIERIFKSL